MLFAFILGTVAEHIDVIIFFDICFLSFFFANFSAFLSSLNFSFLLLSLLLTPTEQQFIRCEQVSNLSTDTLYTVAGFSVATYYTKYLKVHLGFLS